jgi:hypothetical protein
MFRLWPLLLTLLVATVACIEAPPAESLNQGGSLSDSPSLATVAPADLRFGEGESTAVISSAQKFILPVGDWGAAGEPLVYPMDHAQAGAPIVDYQGNPIGDRGLVFFNYADQSVQAVPGDGSGVIIINEVTADQALALYQKVASLGADPHQLPLDQLKQVLAYAQDDLGLGDRYNSTRDFIQAQMSPVRIEAPTQGDAVYGFKKRDSRDISQAVYIPGAFRFAGPAATPQVFDNGGVIVQQQDSLRGVQPDIFIRTYTFSDGRPIGAVTDLATQTPLQ